MKEKKFDAVRMKENIQKELLEEWGPNAKNRETSMKRVEVDSKLGTLLKNLQKDKVLKQQSS